MTRAGVLLLLGLRLARARWRLAWRRRHGPAGLLVGGAGTLVAWALLVASALVFAAVGTTLLAVLVERGRQDLATAVAGAIADAATVLAILAVAASEETRRGVPPLPLTLLPVRPADRLLAELAGLLLAEPLGAIAWPAALVLVLGPGQASPRAALLMAVPAAGLFLGLGTLGLALRHLVLEGKGRRLPAAILATALVFAAPVAWLAGSWKGAGNLLRFQAGPWTPGWWIRQAFREALAGRPAALLPGGCLLLVAFGLAVAAALRAREIPGPGRTRRGAGVRPLALARAYWSARPVVAQWTGNTAAALLVLVAGHALLRQGLPGAAVARGASLLAGLVLAGAPAPLLANLLGSGGRGPLGLLLAGARPGPLLVRLALGVLAPAAVVVPGAAVVAGLLLPGADSFLLLLAAAIAALGAGTGAGMVLSVAWSVPVFLDVPGAPLWPPGPGRWIMLLAQGLVLAPFAVAGPVAMPVAVAAGVLAAGTGWAFARRALRVRVLEVTETLLT